MQVQLQILRARVLGFLRYNSHMGRPRTLSSEQIDDALHRISDGESAKSVLASFGLGPSVFILMARRDPEFAKRYSEARQACSEVHAQSIQDDYDETPPRGPDGKVDSGWVQMQRLKIDSKKWIASKLMPKKYGDKLELSGDSAAPLTVVVRRLTDKPPEADE